MMSEIHERGACVGSDRHHLFFSEHPSELREAQAICAGCEVRIACLELAVSEQMEWGVWGGVVFWDGQPYYRKRGRGRPSRAEQNLPVEASWDDPRAMVQSA